VQEHLFLGIDKRDAEAQRDLWLSQNPAIKVIKIHGVKREPPSLLTRIGGKRVPRVSILVEYEASGRTSLHGVYHQQHCRKKVRARNVHTVAAIKAPMSISLRLNLL
jgi:hypothetical protein